MSCLSNRPAGLGANATSEVMFFATVTKGLTTFEKCDHHEL